MYDQSWRPATDGTINWSLHHATDLSILQEKYQERKKNLHMVFVELEKAYDRVPRDLIWWALRKKNIPEACITIIQDMH